jgi:hypothetical protein
MATGNTLDESTTKLQRAADDIATWIRKWSSKLNETKFTYINFTNQKIDQRSILLNGVRIPPVNIAMCLGITLDAKLRWKAHIKKKQEELQIKFRKMYWCSDADLNCKCTISCFYLNNSCDQYGQTVSNCGDVQKKQNRHNATVSE